jgi:hypothetical protein
MISALNLTVRAHALNTLSRQFGLLLGRETHQSLAYFGIRKDPLAVITGESPPRHSGIVATGDGRGNTQVGVFFARAICAFSSSPALTGGTICRRSVKVGLFVQDDGQERSVNLKTAVVFYETELPEFIHEKIDPGARRADHLRQRFLRYFGEYSLGSVFFAITGKQ